MTFLELVRALAQMTGTIRVADPVNETIDTLVGTDVPHLIDLKRWINSAWAGLQMDSTWLFMIKEGTFDTVAGQKEYELRGTGNLVPDFRKLLPYAKNGNVSRYIRVDDRQAALEVHWEDWTGVEERMTLADARPRHFTVTPDRKIRFSPTPDATYTITFNYLRTLQNMDADNDQPIMPEEHHELIAYRALIKYAGYEESAMQYQRAIPEYRERLLRLRNDQLHNTRVKGLAS